MRSKEEEEKSKNVWLKGHTGMQLFFLCVLVCLSRIDFGSVSILWSQPVGGLQIQAPDGGWKWVRHIDNALVRN
jgi:hypothetical protein